MANLYLNFNPTNVKVGVSNSCEGEGNFRFVSSNGFITLTDPGVQQQPQLPETNSESQLRHNLSEFLNGVVVLNQVLFEQLENPRGQFVSSLNLFKKQQLTKDGEDESKKSLVVYCGKDDRELKNVFGRFNYQGVNVGVSNSCGGKLTLVKGGVSITSNLKDFRSALDHIDNLNKSVQWNSLPVSEELQTFLDDVVQVNLVNLDKLPQTFPLIEVIKQTLKFTPTLLELITEDNENLQQKFDLLEDNDVKAITDYNDSFDELEFHVLETGFLDDFEQYLITLVNLHVSVDKDAFVQKNQKKLVVLMQQFDKNCSIPDACSAFKNYLHYRTDVIEYLKKIS